jgi:hypothetical protein
MVPQRAIGAEFACQASEGGAISSLPGGDCSHAHICLSKGTKSWQVSEIKHVTLILIR